MKSSSLYAQASSLFVLTIFLSPFLSAVALGSGNKVAKAVMLRGQVKSKSAESAEAVDLKQDDWVTEGSIVQTADKSFVKFLLQDQSQVSLGPNSKMVIGAFPKNDPGLIKLINGQLKSQVTKDPSEKGENKLIIKTKTAAMGIRGTSLMVLYNNENQRSSTVTFEGEVAMAHLDPKSSDGMNSPNQLGDVLSGNKTVSVHEGQFSGCGGNNETSLPQKMSPAQFDSLASTDGFNVTSEKATAPAPEYQSPVPPNVDAKDFANNGEALKETLAASAGSDVVAAAEQIVSSKEEARSTDVPPEGVFNQATGEFAPPAGGFIDLTTGIYIAPPAGSTFDAQAGVFIPPPNLGSFDPATGAYLAPAGTELKADGTFVAAPTSGSAGTAPMNAPLPPPVPMAPAEAKGFGGGVFDAQGVAGGAKGGGEFFSANAAPTAERVNAPKSIDNPDVFVPPVMVTPIPAGLNQTTVNINVNVI